MEENPKFSAWKVAKKFPVPGQTFGSWTVLREHRWKPGERQWFRWDCMCRCGFRAALLVSELRYGRKACDACISSARAERVARSRSRSLWKGMWDRCERKNHKAYHRYGGRGISVCERWRSFDNFYSDMGPRPVGKTLDRKNNDGNYEPGNCRWATKREQMGNTRANHWLELDGVRMHVTDWSRKTGLLAVTIKNRLKLGWSIRRALETKADSYANCHRGSKSPNAKLSESDVVEMRRLHREKTLGYRRLAKKFGVRVETAKAAVDGVTWRHVVDPAQVPPDAFDPL